MAPASGDANLSQTPPTPLSRIKWSWWWLFLAALLVWMLVRGGEPNKQSASKLLALSLADAQASRFAECLTSAKQAIQADPKLAEAYNNAGWCAANLGRWDEGIQNVSEALRLNPNLEVAKNNLDWMLRQKTVTIAASAPPATPADSALLLSLRHAREHRYPECVAAARQALALKPDMAEAFNNLGFCYGGMGNWDEGINSIREALRIQPNFPLASNNLSWMVGEKAKMSGHTTGK